MVKQFQNQSISDDFVNWNTMRLWDSGNITFPVYLAKNLKVEQYDKNKLNISQ